MDTLVITPELKDEVLSSLLSSGTISVRCNLRQSAEELHTTPDFLVLIYRQFEELGLISLKFTLDGWAFIKVKANAHDFFRYGGFSAQEELLKANLEKLGMELDLLAKQLSPDLADKAFKISAIAANVMSALSFFKP